MSHFLTMAEQAYAKIKWGYITPPRMGMAEVGYKSEEQRNRWQEGRLITEVIFVRSTDYSFLFNITHPFTSPPLKGGENITVRHTVFSFR